MAAQAPRPRDSPGKNTGVGCHFFSNACMHAKSLQSRPWGNSNSGIWKHWVLGLTVFLSLTPCVIYLRQALPHSELLFLMCKIWAGELIPTDKRSLWLEAHSASLPIYIPASVLISPEKWASGLIVCASISWFVKRILFPISWVALQIKWVNYASA